MRIQRRQADLHYEHGSPCIGPGIQDWPTGGTAASRAAPLTCRARPVAAPAALPAAERRRADEVQLAGIALGFEAVNPAGVKPRAVHGVLALPGGDGENCHEICHTLAFRRPADCRRRASTTRSRTRLPATGASPPARWRHPPPCARMMQASLPDCSKHWRRWRLTVSRSCSIAYDANYPAPLLNEADSRRVRHGRVLAASPGPRTLARIGASRGEGDSEHLDDPRLEALRSAVPAARGLAVLARLAQRRWGTVAIEYLGSATLCIEVHPC